MRNYVKFFVCLKDSGDDTKFEGHTKVNFYRFKFIYNTLAKCNLLFVLGS